MYCALVLKIFPLLAHKLGFFRFSDIWNDSDTVCLDISQQKYKQYDTTGNCPMQLNLGQEFSLKVVKQRWGIIACLNESYEVILVIN